jgi:hypothetical protein
MTDALATRAAELNDELAALRHARALAVLAGESFDSQSIAAAEAELAALADAEGEAVKRARAAASAAAAERRAATMSAIAAKEAARVLATGRAEAAARALATALDEAMRIAEEERALWRELGSRVPAHLDLPSQELRLSDRLAAVLHTPARPAGFGVVTWRVSWASSDHNWAEAERRLGEAAIAEIERD